MPIRIGRDFSFEGFFGVDLVVFMMGLFVFMVRAYFPTTQIIGKFFFENFRGNFLHAV